MVGFGDLPVELTPQILVHLAPANPIFEPSTRDDITACAQVCRWWRELCAPFFWRDISLSFIEDVQPVSQDGLVGFSVLGSSLVLHRVDCSDTVLGSPNATRNIEDSAASEALSIASESPNHFAGWTVATIARDPTSFLLTCHRVIPAVKQMFGSSESCLRQLGIGRREVKIALAKTISSAHHFFTTHRHIAAMVRSLNLAPHRSFSGLRYPHEITPLDILELVSCFPALEELRLEDIYFDFKEGGDMQNLPVPHLKKLWITFEARPRWQSLENVLDACSVFFDVDEVVIDQSEIHGPAEETGMDLFLCKPKSISLRNTLDDSLFTSLTRWCETGQLVNLQALAVTLPSCSPAIIESFKQLLAQVGHRLDTLELGFDRFFDYPKHTLTFLTHCLKLTHFTITASVRCLDEESVASHCNCTFISAILTHLDAAVQRVTIYVDCSSRLDNHSSRRCRRAQRKMQEKLLSLKSLEDVVFPLRNSGWADALPLEGYIAKIESMFRKLKVKGKMRVVPEDDLELYDQGQNRRMETKDFMVPLLG